jgi:hypothetical protein
MIVTVETVSRGGNGSRHLVIPHHAEGFPPGSKVSVTAHNGVIVVTKIGDEDRAVRILLGIRGHRESHSSCKSLRGENKT